MNDSTDELGCGATFSLITKQPVKNRPLKVPFLYMSGKAPEYSAIGPSCFSTVPIA
eukprot:CAMPEP_0182513458 /NCGR_PEP_ID=MMETSP1321-20130603/34019_1 /TAXON_ID=91990 /ORGANISM="Bolidomonas sp., Strain RCC1657" /LENGTH=55 /DNA_ID=CAMNT_0024720475 /DNA_START=108 /DNA_END=275 /DNA_ORIENTATION=-